ncbi:type III effector [Shewanella algicola]|uniref:HopJ type III effector protein n=1 Tax=Shewanella algicola TaxID=640633 RepID=A0A9X1Z651_9GAMM|nr:HopJ type III effector protein [Shewanella algicola]MCL1105904.1 HopJ type III effector protein [Shewanella algicola]GGP55769.1 type III effector [Shewanella algicola]
MSATQVNEFITSLAERANEVRFEETMALIDAHYDFTPTAFKNGDQLNDAGQNSGSCKVFAFGQIQQLTEQQTLQLFGQHYRDVVATPQGDDHQNIRQFMQHGWPGVLFSQSALTSK